MEQTIYLAGGCFWGTDHFFRQVTGVVATQTGYANSHVPSPTYEDVCRGTTGAAETVKVVFDDSIIQLDQVLDLYLLTIDPLSVNRQGRDVGEQYRTGIYYSQAEQEPVVEQTLQRLSAMVGEKPAVEAMALINFYPAETMHQDYLNKNVFGYCHIDRSLFSLARDYVPHQTIDRDYQGNLLSFLSYKVTQFGCTETPYENQYWDQFDDGIYVDLLTGEALFSSRTKFFSDSGWAAFSEPLSPQAVMEKQHSRNQITRTELCNRAGTSHLGELFEDSAESESGRMYSTNSAAVRFIPKDQMEKEGYGEYLSVWNE